jgi:hypothetical protein
MPSLQIDGFVGTPFMVSAMVARSGNLLMRFWALRANALYSLANARHAGAVKLVAF